jgi:hypothetical protein
MLHLAFLTAVLLGAAPAPAGQDVNPGFNFDGIEAFWAIAAVLESGEEPTEMQWETFFSSPGYDRLAGEFGRSYFQRALRAALKPDGGKLEQEMVREYAERGGFLGWYTPSVIEGFKSAAGSTEWLAERVEELRAYPYLEKAAEFALEYLPDETVDEYPAVNFVVFSDSRGYMPLIMGLTGEDELTAAQLECLESQGYDHHLPFMLLMAHESFHMYRDTGMRFELPDTGDPDYPLLWTIDQITNEGIGDLIYRKPLYYGDGCMADSERGANMQREQLAQPATIRILDTILAEIAAAPELARMLGGQLQSFVPQSGHPTGYFMANLIEEELGHDVIRAVVRDPFAFFAAYSRAAEQSGAAPFFSAESLAYLDHLQKTHIR